jgi:large subunit ribosomal protein L35
LGSVFFEGIVLMPKQKTHKGLTKRIKVTAGGRLKRKRSGGGHLMSTKNAKRRRKIAGSAIVTGAVVKTLKMRLGK